MNDTAAASSERFLVALGSGLLLIAPLAWTLDATSYVGVLLGLAASLLVAVASGLLLAPALPGSVGTTLMTLAFFSPTVLIALLVLGPASSPTTTALGLGVPAAALSAALATRTALGLNQVNGTSTCSENEDGFVVVEEPGRDTEVVATIGRTRLEATLYQREGDLPDPDDVGRALLDADLVDWDGLLRIVETAD